MRLAFWRREPEPIAWYHIDRAVPYAMAAEMATWPEPIDVIREALSLPPRLRVRVGRAWNAVWSAITYDPTLELFRASGSLMSSMYHELSTTGMYVKPWRGANTGNPTHDEALRHWMRVTRLPDGSRRTEGGTRRVGPAGTGNPIHDQALRRARGF